MIYIKNQKYTKQNLQKETPADIKSDRGYSLIELSVVLVILSILASVSLPSISKWLKLAKIDEAKSLVNSSLAECIQTFRDGSLPADTSPPDRVISNERLESANYKIKSSDNNCSSFFITPTSETEDVLFEFGFKITSSGQVTKIATPANNSTSLSSCKGWAGTNCGASAEQLAAWAQQEAIEAAKQQCESDYSNWFTNTPPSGGDGSYNRWDSSSNSCTRKVWACEGSSVSDENAYVACREAILGAACNSKIQEAKDAKLNEEKTFSECGDRVFYFCLGEDKQTSALMNTCITANQEAVCKTEREQTRVASLSSNSYPPNGKWGPKVGPGECSVPKWICKGIEHPSEQAYDEDTNCNAPAPPCEFEGAEDIFCGPSGIDDKSPFCTEYNQRCRYNPNNNTYY